MNKAACYFIISFKLIVRKAMIVFFNFESYNCIMKYSNAESVYRFSVTPLKLLAEPLLIHFVGGNKGFLFYQN